MTYSPDFEYYFWSVYPKKIGKAQAAKEWDKLAPDDDLKRQIREHIEARKRFDKRWLPNKEGNTFIVDPERFLKHRRFEDEYERVRTAPARAVAMPEAPVLPAWQERGFPSPEAYRAHCDRQRDAAMAALRDARLLH